jgi:parallel beta-helix repeat protein
MKSLYNAMLILLLLSACKQVVDPREGVSWTNLEAGLQTQIIMAQEGDTIRLEEGYFWFTRSLLVDHKKNLTIMGAGIDKTVLSFKGQEEGAEGLRVTNSAGIVLQDFTIEDAKGDNIKVSDTDGITFRRLKSWWTAGAKATNGAYALYPVLCNNVLIEECIAARASDAGIYVGQSDTVIIRNNYAYENVAGIESENSNYVEIYGNEAYNNTGGILVFDLPGLTQYGRYTKVYGNKVIRNNHFNFAPAGNIVGVVPPGTGIMLLATRDIEISENEIIDNRTVGLAIVSYELVIAMNAEEEAQSTEEQVGSVQRINNNYGLDSLYNPYPENMYIHSNTFKNSMLFPTMKSDFGKLFFVKFPFATPDIVFDGFVDEFSEKGLRLCIRNNGEIKFANLDVPNEFANINKDQAPYDCSGYVFN